MIDFGGIFAQVSRMSLWNYGTEVMDALLELITSLVHDSFVSPLDICNHRATCQNLISLMLVYFVCRLLLMENILIGVWRCS